MNSSHLITGYKKDTIGFKGGYDNRRSLSRAGEKTISTKEVLFLLQQALEDVSAMSHGLALHTAGKEAQSGKSCLSV